MVLSLFHGNAYVERGFSINKEVLQNNMIEKSVVARRQVYDGVSGLLLAKDASVKEVFKIDINSEILKYCRGARAKYQCYLDEKIAEKRTAAETSKVTELNSLLQSEKDKICQFESSIERLNKDADQLALDAERKGNLGLLKKSNLSRKRSADVAGLLKSSRNKIQKIKEDLKKINTK